MSERASETPSETPTSPGDGELATRARDGDRDALETLLRRQYGVVHRLCRRLTGNDADADDATQEALLAIARGLPRFDGVSAFGTWAYRVATNACLDELRRRRRRPEPVADDPAAPTWEHPPDEVAAQRVDVDAALARLPLEFRAAVMLRDLCGLDYAEIAEVLGVPAGTVRSRIARGRAALVPLLARNQTAEPERPKPVP